MKSFEKRIWLASPTMFKEEREYVKEAFDTNWVSTVGENINQLEHTMAEYVGTNYAVGLASGTAALHLATKLAGVKPGDKVFCTDMTFAATVNPVSYEHAEQVFIDSEYETWNMDPVALEKAFEKYPDVKVVILVNLYGTPCKFDEILEICKKHNAIIIEDAAESLGSTYKGVKAGTFGTYNIISFGGNKIITTSGGGVLLTDDQKAADKARKWATQSKEPAPWYQHEEMGYNYRLSNVLAGIGRGQMLHLDELLAKKKEIYERYKEGLKDLPITMNPYLDGMEPNFWLSCLLIDKDVTVTPGEIREKLEAYNVESRPIWKPMHMQPIYKDREVITATDGVNVAEDVFARGLCLPSDVKMTKEEQDIVIEMIRSCF